MTGILQALRLSMTALGETTAGQVVNMMSNDVGRFDMAIIFLHYLWIGPIETCVVTYFMWNEVGMSAGIGVASLLLFIPLQGDNFNNIRHLTLQTISQRYFNFVTSSFILVVFVISGRCNIIKGNDDNNGNSTLLLCSPRNL